MQPHDGCDMLQENEMSGSQKGTSSAGRDNDSNAKSGGSKQQTASTEKGSQQGGHKSDDRQQGGKR